MYVPSTTVTTWTLYMLQTSLMTSTIVDFKKNLFVFSDHAFTGRSEQSDPSSPFFLVTLLNLQVVLLRYVLTRKSDARKSKEPKCGGSHVRRHDSE